MLALAHAAAIATPLRLTPDATAYLSIGARLADGEGYGPAANGATFPPALPALYATLDWLGLGSTRWLVLVNLLALSVALAAAGWTCVRGLGQSRTGAVAVCIASALSFVVVKHVAIPESELVFFALTSVTLALLVRLGREWRLVDLVAAAGIAAAACATRTAGIALLPAFVAALPTARARLIGGGALVLAAVGAVLLGPSRYLDEVRDRWSDGVVTQAWESVESVLRSTGELASNLPSTQTPRAVDIALLGVGAAALAVVGLGVRRRHGRPAPLVAFLAATLVLVLLWGVSDVRFLLPAVPYVAVYGWEGLCALAPRRAALAVGVVLASLGVVALAYSIRISFSGDAFPERYGDGTLTPTYRVAFGLARPGDAARVDPFALDVLRGFEPRADRR